MKPYFADSLRIFSGTNRKSPCGLSNSFSSACTFLAAPPGFPAALHKLRDCPVAPCLGRRNSIRPRWTRFIPAKQAGIALAHMVGPRVTIGGTDRDICDERSRGVPLVATPDLLARAQALPRLRPVTPRGVTRLESRPKERLLVGKTDGTLNCAA